MPADTRERFRVSLLTSEAPASRAPSGSSSSRSHIRFEGCSEPGDVSASGEPCSPSRHTVHWGKPVELPRTSDAVRAPTHRGDALDGAVVAAAFDSEADAVQSFSDDASTRTRPMREAMAQGARRPH
jgi:hypothetical protein